MPEPANREVTTLSARVGDTFAGYRVINALGSGGMGDVYLVENPRLHRAEALKVTRIRADAESARRFSLEASTMAALDHPSIATVYQYGVDGDFAWYSMRYLEGKDLSQVSALPVDSVITIVTQIGDALDYAHACGVIHRDVKPANIHIRRSESGAVEHATMLDFGVAKMLDVTSMTQESSFVGTLTYSSPEAIVGDHSHPAVDQYSFACTVFELLTGRPPFPERTVSALIAAHTTAPAPAISSCRTDLSAADWVFVKALAKNPEQRFRDCRSFAAALVTALRGDGSRRVTADCPMPLPDPASRAPRRRSVLRRRWAAAAVICLVLAVLAAVVVLRQRPQPAAPVHAAGPASGGDAAPSAPARTGADPEAGRAGPGTDSDRAASGDTWGMVIDPDGTTYAFRNFQGSAAMLAEARAKWGYDAAAWGSVYFESGCGAFAFPESPAPEGSAYQFGLGPDRPG